MRCSVNWVSAHADSYRTSLRWLVLNYWVKNFIEHDDEPYTVTVGYWTHTQHVLYIETRPYTMEFLRVLWRRFGPLLLPTMVAVWDRRSPRWLSLLTTPTLQWRTLQHIVSSYEKNFSWMLLSRTRSRWLATQAVRQRSHDEILATDFQLLLRGHSIQIHCDSTMAQQRSSR